MIQFLTQSTWTDLIGWVLVHSLWQFALVALVAIVLRRAMQRCSAASRYGALLAAMLIMVAMPVATWFSPWCADAPAVAVKFDAGENPEKVSSLQHGDDTMPIVAPQAARPVRFAEKPQTETLRLEPAAIGMASTWSIVKRQVQPWLAKIALIWFTGVLVVAIRPILSWYTVRRLRRVGVSPVGAPVHSVLERTAAKLRLARTVEVLQSTLVKTPIVVGCFRPVVLLPLCVVAGLPVMQLEMILAHELAHIRRHDYLVNLLQTLVETLFFYHPAVWWLSRQIRNERENCCDDVAMATVGSRADYGRALLAIAELRATSPSLSLAASDGSLLARIRRIAGSEPTPRVVGGGSILGVIMVLIAVFTVITWGATPAAEVPEANDRSDKTSTGKPEGQTIFAGVCHDDEGRAIAGAQLSLFLDDFETLSDERLQSTRTDQAGRFRFEPVAALRDSETFKQYLISAAANGRATVVLNRPNPPWRVADHLQIAISEAASLRGKIMGPDGRPVEGAKVWTSLTQGPIDGIHTATSNAEGLYEISDLEKRDGKPVPVPGHPGAFSQLGYFLTVQRPHFAGALATFSQVPSTVNVTLQPAAGIKGRVVYGDSEKPAAGVRLCARPIPVNDAYRRQGEAITDSKGRYHFDALAAGRYNIFMLSCKEGYTMAALESFETTADTTKTALDLRLVHGGLIVGRVIDADSGKPFRPLTADPLQNRPYIRMYGPSRPWSGGACETASIQEDGSFQLRAAPGNNYVDLQRSIGRPLPGVNSFGIEEDCWQEVSPGSLELGVAEGQTVTVEFKLRKKRVTETASSKQQVETQPATRSSSGTANSPAVTEASGTSGRTSAAKPADEVSPAKNQSGSGDKKASTDLPRGASSAAKTEDGTLSRSEKRRKELAELGIVMPPDHIPVPAYQKLGMSDVRRHFGITAAQEKKLREISATFQAEESKLTDAYEEWRELPPQERKTAPEEWHTKYENLRHPYRKPIEEVLTAEQRTAYKHNIRGETAWFICIGSSLDKLAGIELSEQQQQQAKRLVEEVAEIDRRKTKSILEQALTVLSPQQRQQLLARFTDAEVVAPFVYLPPTVGRGAQKTSARTGKSPLDFSFYSGNYATVSVYSQLTDLAVLKELALTAEQEAKLQVVRGKSLTAAQEIFARYESKAAAAESPAAQKSAQTEYHRALGDYGGAVEQFGRDVIGQIEAVLQPQQVATLKAIARTEKASWTLLQQNRAALDDLHATGEQRAKWRQMSNEHSPVPNMPLPAAAVEKAVAILTPEQLEKLDKAIEQYGW
jgi:beta-lactamase regulating signal transducer with metallopeptidase domain